MNHKKLKRNTTVILTTAALAAAPFTFAEMPEDAQQSDAYHQDTSLDLKISVGGVFIAMDELKGATVLNREGERLGEVEDIVLASKGNEATHVIVTTDNWFDDRAAIVPIHSLIVGDHSQNQGIADKMLGQRVLLDMTEERFDEMATFTRGTDLETYLENNGKGIAESFDLDENEVFDSALTYRSAFTNRSEKESSEGIVNSLTTTVEKTYRYITGAEETPTHTLEIDGVQIESSEIRGADVVNLDDERLGKVVDIAVDESGNGTNYLVVRTDDWFDGDHALVPLNSVRYHQNAKDPHMNDGANWWTGEHIVLDMSEDQFEQIADYKRADDPKRYIEENRARISKQYKVGADSLAASDAAYIFVYSVPYTPVNYSAPRSDLADYDAKANYEKPDNLTVELGGMSEDAENVRGTKVQSINRKEVATVSDFVIDLKTGEAEFLVLENKKGSEHMIVPMSAVKGKDVQSEKSTYATWNGKSITLSAKASQVAKWATFEKRSDFDSFLSQNAEKISTIFGIDQDDLTDSSLRYEFFFESANKQTALR